MLGQYVVKFSGLPHLWGVFLFLIFLSTKSSSWVNSSILTSNCLLIILVIGSWVTFWGFLSKFLKCCFHRCIRSCWLVAFSLALVVLFLLLTLFIACHAILDCLSSNESHLIDLIFYVFCLFFQVDVSKFILCLFKFQGIGIGWVLPVASGGIFHVCMFFSNC